jgi:hypothetical protein
MSKYNPETREQVMNLKDGRTIFKTHNGFRNFVISKSGKSTTKVTEEYYSKAKRTG